MTGEQVHNLTFCRGYDYYVNPDSTEILELGTKQYPYKNLMLPFIEIFNFHSNNPNIEINIYVYERSYLEISFRKINIINIFKVNLYSYTEIEDEPAKVELVVRDTEIDYWNVKTRFNILANSVIDFESQSTNRTQEQIDLFNQQEVAITVSRANFKISGFAIYCNFTGIDVSMIFISVLLIQDKYIEITDWDFRGSGRILNSQTPLNLIVTNTEIDYYNMNQGFYMAITWNFTGAVTTNDIIFDNVTVYNSKERTAVIENSFIYFGGSSNVTIMNSNINVYGLSTQQFSPVKIGSLSTWNPDDEVTQNINIKNTEFSFTQSDSNDRFTQINIEILESSNRNTIINIEGLTFNHIDSNLNSLIEISGNLKSTVSVENIEIDSNSFQSSVYSFSGMGTLNLKSLSLNNITEFGNPLISIDDALLYSQTGNNETSVVIDNLTISSTTVESYSAIDIASMPNIAIINSQFSDITVGSDNYLISLDTLYGFNIQNCNFTQIVSTIQGDNSNKIINLVSLNASQTVDLLIDNIVVERSELSFFVLDRISDAENTSKTFNISNAQFLNSQYNSSNDIITFTKMEEDINFTIYLHNISFSNITFEVNGNLLLFEQQLKNQLIIQNIDVSDIKVSTLYGKLIHLV